MLFLKPLAITISLSIPLEYNPPENKFAKDIPWPVYYSETLPPTMEYSPFPKVDSTNVIYEDIIRELEKEAKE